MSGVVALVLPLTAATTMAALSPPASAKPQAREVTGPAFAGDFPDPSVVVAGGLYYAYSTQSGGANIQLITSTDLIHWAGHGDALPSLPA